MFNWLAFNIGARKVHCQKGFFSGFGFSFMALAKGFSVWLEKLSLAKNGEKENIYKDWNKIRLLCGRRCGRVRQLLDDQKLLLREDLHSNPLYRVSCEKNRHFPRERDVVLLEVIAAVAVVVGGDGR